MNFMHEGPVMMPNGVLNVHPLGAPVLNNNSALGAKNGAAEIPEEHAPEEQAHIDIIPRNVVCSFSVGCHLDLKKIAWHGCNVQYRHPTNVVLMKLRHPLCTAHIWSSGKVTCTGAATEADAKRASRKIARFLQKLEFPVKFRNYRVVNVLATCNFPFGIKLADLYGLDRSNAQYEPELHPGLTFKCPDLSASLKIFSTGSVTITAPSLGNITKAVERVFPFCVSSRKPKPLLPGKAKDVKEDDDDFDVLLESPDVPNL